MEVFTEIHVWQEEDTRIKQSTFTLRYEVVFKIFYFQSSYPSEINLHANSLHCFSFSVKILMKYEKWFVLVQNFLLLCHFIKKKTPLIPTKVIFRKLSNL